MYNPSGEAITHFLKIIIKKKYKLGWLVIYFILLHI
jgi:hypothetical protein